LAWPAENQTKIEQKIFQFRNEKTSIKQVFLYDVTSSYLEGQHNELASYGYNRDKKKGKNK
jgi:transposase